MNLASTSWMSRAACRDEDPDLFVEPDIERPWEKAARESAAKAVCARCPVPDPCLAFAVGRRDNWTVAGGTTPDERAASRRARYARIQRNAALAEEGLRECGGLCGEVKALGEFNRNGRGWQSECKECHSARNLAVAS